MREYSVGREVSMADFYLTGDHNVSPLKHEPDQKRGWAPPISSPSLKLPPPPPPSPQFLTLKRLNTQLSEPLLSIRL